MTAANLIGTRYANALFALAAEGNQQPAVATAVAALAGAVEDTTVAATLANPRLTPAQRTALATSMAKAVKAPAPLANTLGVLGANNRLGILAGVLSAYQDLNDTASGVTHVQLSSAAPLTDAQRTKLSEMLKKHTNSASIRLEETVDASLQGGFRAFFNGSVWDASLSGSIARIGTRLKAAVAQRQS